MPQRLAAILFCLLMQGCIIIDTGVTNPLPGMSRIAVVPFRNLTDHPDGVVDGRRFAITYASELQKVPGYEVVPVGVTEVAMVESGLKFDSPDDLLKLAEMLNVDAIAVGAVTNYNPYYPPRIGLQVEWLSPNPWMFSPGVATDPTARKWLISSAEDEREERIRAARKAHKKSVPFLSGLRNRFRMPVIFRGQSPDEETLTDESDAEELEDNWQPIEASTDVAQNVSPEPTSETAANTVSERQLPPAIFNHNSHAIAVENPPLPSGPLANVPLHATTDTLPLLQSAAQCPLPLSTTGPENWSPGHSPTEPIMAYSRFFDGSDADLVAELRDYAELNGDLRGGGWEGYLQRSDDFIRFICHRMIEEMLTLHGGEAKRRIVVKFRKYK